MGSSNLLGDSFKPYVQKQVKTRQSILGNSTKSSNQIVWENGKTAYVSLVSSINIENQPDTPIFSFPPSVLSQYGQPLREKAYEDMARNYVASTTSTPVERDAERMMEAIMQFEEADKRIVELDQTPLTDAEADKLALGFNDIVAGVNLFNTDKGTSFLKDEIVTLTRFRKVEERWRQLKRNGKVSSQTLQSALVGDDIPDNADDVKNPYLRNDETGYTNLESFLLEKYVIRDSASIIKQAKEEADKYEELLDSLPESIDTEQDTGDPLPTPDKTILLYGKYKVNLATGPANHRKRPLGNWQSDNAWDLFAPIGTSVESLTNGTVSKVRVSAPADNDKVYGTQVTITGEQTYISSTGETKIYPNIFYTHLKDVNVKVGDKVIIGQIIGFISEWPNHESASTHVHIGLQEGYQLADLVGYDGSNLEEIQEALPEVDEGDGVLTFTDSLVSLGRSEQIGSTPGRKDGIKRIQLLDLEGDPTQYLDNFIAKNLVLSSGVVTINEDGSRVQKYGVANEISTFNNFAYGFGGDKDWGLVGMPGLTNVSVKSKNMGSLREATVSIRANSERQFSLIDALYCRIGYTMFLEWGNTSYFTDEETYVANPQSNEVSSLIPKFLNPGKDACVGANKGIQNKIEENRRLSCGNYDAFIGRVSNFSWDFTPEGYYNITLTLISIGDIVESLQIDQPLSDSLPTAPLAPGSEIQPNNTSALAKFLTIAATPNGSGNFFGGRWSIFGDKGIGGWLSSEESLNNSYDVSKRTLVGRNTFTTYEESGWWGLGKTLLGFTTAVIDLTPVVTIVNIATKSTVTGQLYDANIGSFVTDTIPPSADANTDHSAELDYSRLVTSVGKVISGRAVFGTNTYNYIRLGDILDFIKDKLLIYNSICDKEPILDIDTNTDSNFCYYPGGNVSADPSKVMIATFLPVTTANMENFAKKQAKDPNSSVANTKPYWSNPVYTNKIFGYNNGILEPFVTTEGFSGTKQKLNVGQIMNIYFEYDYLMSTMDKNRDEDNSKLNLYDFVDDLLKTANNCLGGVNKLSIRLENENVLRIYDQISPYGSQTYKYENDIPPIINLYGFRGNDGSFVRDFNIKTELTNDFATIVTVGAQANGSKDTTDALALSNWNFGLVDRFLPEKISSSIKKKSSTPSSDYENLIKLRDQLFYLWLGYAEGKIGSYSFDLSDNQRARYDKEDKDGNQTSNTPGLDQINEDTSYYFEHFQTERYNEFVKLQKDFFAMLHINSDYNSNQQGMIPLKIEVTMDGLSGIRIYDNMEVDTRFIPSYYPQTLKWIISGVSHKIQNNQWVTELDTIAVPKLPEIPVGKTPLSSTRYKSYSLIPLSDLGGESFTQTIDPTTLPNSNVVDSWNNVMQNADQTGTNRIKQFIGQYESGNKYDIANSGRAGQLSTTKVDDKSIGDLLDNFAKLPNNDPARVFAMGRMQIVPDTLSAVLGRSYVKDNGITRDTVFGEAVQEIIFDHLILNTRSSIGNYILGKNDGTEADLSSAINSLGYEWAFAPVLKQNSNKFSKSLTQDPSWKGTNYGGSAGNPSQSKLTVKQVAEILISARQDGGFPTPFIV